ncbi:MAG TPA: GGDEF domain-containing protein [Candidatus Aquabacterium excrementipullorum]|nr:GGDEF domain-containing protein [Candidatus Aquabacterium excrementipullorum]
MIFKRRSVSLAGWFWLISAALSIMALLVLLRLSFVDWREVRRTEVAVAMIKQLRLGLAAVEMTSRERGPANGVLGADAQSSEALREALAQARERTDQAFAAYAKGFDFIPDPARRQAAKQQMANFQVALRQARGRVDALSALPLSQREAADIKGAVDGMVALVRMLRPVIMVLTDRIQQNLPAVSATAVGALLASELRETTGQLGSLFTPALSHQTPLSEDERMAIAHMRGRIEQLRTLLSARVQIGGVQPAAARAHERLEHDYFGRAEGLIQQMLQAGRTDGHYGLSPAEFAARYVPDMGAIVDVRNALLDESLARGQALRSEQYRTMAVMLTMTGLNIALIAWGLILLHRRVIRPLTHAAQALDAMKHDRCMELRVPNTGDEISAVLDGIAALQAQQRQRADLEAERDKLIERLRVQSSTDFLTALPNRRAFFEAAEAEIARARRHGFGLVLLLLDVDHFKRINDGLGHGAGDLALVSISTVLRQSMRQGDIAARIGGEEFVVLLSHCEREDGLRFAERLRHTVATTPVEVGAGHPPLRMTVSIGLVDTASQGLELDALMKQADRAMYRAKAGGRDRIELAETA